MIVTDPPSRRRGPVVSVLDLVGVGHGQTTARALADLLEYARTAERLDVARFWIAEQHASALVASAAPAVLVGAVAGATRRLRVGTGGMLLPLHSPSELVETFGTLDALHPGRIDLGVGRSRGGAPAPDGVPPGTGPGGHSTSEALDELIERLGPDRPRPSPAHARRPGVGEGSSVPLWLLGRSIASARRAAERGLPYAYAHHLEPTGTCPALAVYRERFVPSPGLPDPYAIVSVQTICGEDDQHAADLALPGVVGTLRSLEGRHGPLPTVEEARHVAFGAAEQEALARSHADQAVGGPHTVASRLAAIRRDTGADELMMTAVIEDVTDRRRSLERTVEALGAAPVDA